MWEKEYICMTGSLCCTAEIDRTLSINYNRKNKNLKKKKKKKILTEPQVWWIKLVSDHHSLKFTAFLRLVISHCEALFHFVGPFCARAGAWWLWREGDCSLSYSAEAEPLNRHLRTRYSGRSQTHWASWYCPSWRWTQEWSEQCCTMVTLHNHGWSERL